MIDHNNLEEFADPELYDLEYGGFDPDGPFFSELALEAGGPILELACGTGRVAIPLARQGFDVSGLDLTPGMLTRARQLAGDLAIDWHHADARDFQLGRQFQLIYMTGNAWQAFLTRADQEALLARVRAHLLPAGFWAFGTRNPRWEDLTIEPVGETGADFINAQGQPVTVYESRMYDPVNQILHYTVERRWQTPAGEQTRSGRIALRYVFPQEMEALLHYNGFTILRCFGNWDRSPLSAASPSMIYVCQLRNM